MLSDILSLGPTSLISAYDGGCNYLFLGTLSKDVRESWPFATKSTLPCVITSAARMGELPVGPFRTKIVDTGTSARRGHVAVGNGGVDRAQATG